MTDRKGEPMGWYRPGTKIAAGHYRTATGYDLKRQLNGKWMYFYTYADNPSETTVSSNEQFDTLYACYSAVRRMPKVIYRDTPETTLPVIPESWITDAEWNDLPRPDGLHTPTLGNLALGNLMTPKTARKSSKSTPTVIGGWLYRDDGEGIQLDTPEWFTWLEDSYSFYHEQNRFTARRERRRNSWYWYAYRKRGGVLRKVYLGTADKLTAAALGSVFNQDGSA